MRSIAEGCSGDHNGFAAGACPAGNLPAEKQPGRWEDSLAHPGGLEVEPDFGAVGTPYHQEPFLQFRAHAAQPLDFRDYHHRRLCRAADWQREPRHHVRVDSLVGAAHDGHGSLPGADLVPVLPAALARGMEDRKSTRLNSSHSQISYSDLCFKQK